MSRTRCLPVLGVVAASACAFVVLATPAVAAGPDTLEAGGVLVAGQSLVSSSGGYRLVMQADGNAVTYDDSGDVGFVTGTSGNPGAYLTLQTDGNLVVYSAAGVPLYANFAMSESAYLVIQGDGNLVEYTPSGPNWSYYSGLINPGRSPVSGPILFSGQTMVPGEALVNGQYVFVLQGDGNLVEYADGGRVVGSTGTDGEGASSSFTMQVDGNAVLYTPDGPQFATGTSGHPGAVLVLQSDGNIVVYDNGVPLFATGPDEG